MFLEGEGHTLNFMMFGVEMDNRDILQYEN